MGGPQLPSVQSQPQSAPQQSTGTHIQHKVERMTDAELKMLGLAPCRNEKLTRLLQMAASREGLDVRRDTELSLYKYYGRYSYSQESQI